MAKRILEILACTHVRMHPYAIPILHFGDIKNNRISNTRCHVQLVFLLCKRSPNLPNRSSTQLGKQNHRNTTTKRRIQGGDENGKINPVSALRSRGFTGKRNSLTCFDTFRFEVVNCIELYSARCIRSFPSRLALCPEAASSTTRLLQLFLFSLIVPARL